MWRSTFRGQLSIEFFLLFAVVLAVFGLFMLFTNEMQTLTSFITASDKASTVAFTIAHAINDAYLGYSGLNATVNIPAGYIITMQPYSIVATDSLNRSGSAPVLGANVTLNISINASQVTVLNLNNTITVTG